MCHKYVLITSVEIQITRIKSWVSFMALENCSSLNYSLTIVFIFFVEISCEGVSFGLREDLEIFVNLATAGLLVPGGQDVQTHSKRV
jgi:hypothetical protein